MSDSESSKTGSDSSSGSESTGSSQSSSSVSSRSSASSKRSAELQRERQGVQESSSDSESSHSTDSSRTSKSSTSSKQSAPAVVMSVKKMEGSSSESDSSKSSRSSAKGAVIKPRSASVSSGTSRTSRTSTSTSGTESSDSEGELGRDSARPKEQDGSSSSSESATSTHSSTSSDSDSESDSSSSGSSDESSASEHNADRDTLRMEKKAEPVKETQIKVEISIKSDDQVKVERRNSMDHMDAEEDPAIANNKWVRLGKFFDRLWFNRLFVPVTGSFTIFLLVVFSILLDIRVSGETGLPYGISFIFILIGLLFWAVMLFCMGLSRVRYALNIQMVPENGSLFEKSVMNKEGARIASFFSFGIALLLLWVFTILISVHVDTPKWTGWHATFIPLWIALGFIGLGITFSARLLKSYVTLFFHVIITAAMTAMCIVIYNKIQGHIGASFYKVLVPLWFLDFFVMILLLWHVASRIVSAIPHFVPVFSKSKKEREPDTMRDSLASIPLAIAGMFVLLFQVCCVIKTENVFIGKYNVTWSVVWLWWWLACAFAWLWCFVYRYKTTSNRSAKRVSKV